MTEAECGNKLRTAGRGEMQSASGGLLESITATANNAGLYSADYSYYDGMNRRNEDVITRTNVSDTGQTSSESQDLGYAYNAKDFLYLVDDNLADTTLDFYTYDGAGNQTGTSLGTANSLNQYSALSYNSRGDVSGDGTYSFGYDANDRLISITPVTLATGSVQLKYGYDGQGRRLWKDVYSYSTTTSSWTLDSTRSRRYVWDGTNVSAELDANNNLVTGYTWGPDGLMAVTDYTVSGSPKTYVALSDASGNLVEYLDPATGTVAASFHYDAWGNLTSSSGPAKSLGSIRGKGDLDDPECPPVRDTPNRSFYRNMWLQRDPSGESGGLNLYEAYGNDPIDNSDPSGLLYSQFIEFANNVGRKYIDPLVNKAVKKVAGQAAADRVAQLTEAARGFNEEVAVRTDVVRALGGIVDHPVQSFHGAADAIDDKIAHAQAVYDGTGSLALAAGDLTDINQIAEGVYNARLLGKPQAVGGGWARFNAIGYGTLGALNTATAVGGAAVTTTTVGSSFLQGVNEAGGFGVTWRKGMVINPFARSAGVTPQLEEALRDGDLRVVSPNEAGLSGAGGRLGSPQTRAQVQAIAGELEKRGWTIIAGGGAGEEFIAPAGGGVRGGAYPDITVYKDGRYLTLQRYLRFGGARRRDWMAA